MILRHKMRTTGMTGDMVSFCAANLAREKGWQWDRSSVLFHKLCEIGMTTNVISFSSAITACQRAVRWKQAVALNHKMRKRHNCQCH